MITIVSIVAVGLAGATAVSANIGILNAASNSPVGTASATADLATPSQQVVDVYLPNSSVAPIGSTSATGADGVQEFAVDTAGTVAISAANGALRLDGVTPAAGWTWVLNQSSQTELTVTMTNGVRALDFVATLTPDGNVSASVNEPIVTPAPPVTNNNGGGGHETGGHETGGHEGGESDD